MLSSLFCKGTQVPNNSSRKTLQNESPIQLPYYIIIANKNPESIRLNMMDSITHYKMRIIGNFMEEIRVHKLKNHAEYKIFESLL